MPQSDKPLYRNLRSVARPYLPHLAGVLVLELLSAPLTLLSPIPLQIAVDSVVHKKQVPAMFQWALGSSPDHPRTLLFGVCLLSLSLALIGQVRNLLSSTLSTYTGQNLLLGFRARLFRHAQNLSLSYHTNKSSTDAMYRIQSDASSIEPIFTDTLIPAITAAFTLVCMLVALLRLDFKIGLIALTVSPLLFLLSRISRPILRAQSRKIKQQESVALAVIHEVLGLLRVVKAFGQEEREQKRFSEQAQSCVKARIRLNLIENGLGLGINMVTATGVASVLYFGINDVLSGALTLGQLLLVLSYVSDIYSPLKTVSRKMVAVQTHLTSLERAFAFLDEPVDVPEHPQARPIERARGEVAFQEARFRYSKEREILKGITFEVAAGARVGIVGVTGSGKTTLSNLLLRLYDPHEGAILLDGTDIREYRLKDLRDQFAVVFQESLLFSSSIRDNIAYGCPHATLEEIERAAQMANIHEFIQRLPDGYDTRVGERGMAVSGGERQRIALARAFLKDAPILVLDEPTSSVDGETEAAIMEAMERLMQGRTTFIIAHRLKTIENCDVILKIEEGSLVSATAPQMLSTY